MNGLFGKTPNLAKDIEKFSAGTSNNVNTLSSLRNFLIGLILIILGIGSYLIFNHHEDPTPEIEVMLHSNEYIVFQRDEKFDVPYLPFKNYMCDQNGNDERLFEIILPKSSNINFSSKFFNRLTYSNDGEKIAFTNSGQLFIMNWTFLNVQKFTKVPLVAHFFFSPDNNNILFQTEGQQLKSPNPSRELKYYSVDFNNPSGNITEQVLLIENCKSLQNVQFTADGKYYLYKRKNEIIVAAFKNGEIKYRHKIDNLFERYPAPFKISPSGKLIAYLIEFKDQDNKNIAQLQIMNIDGSNKKFLYSTRNNIKKFVVWSPDQKFILFSTGHIPEHFSKINIETLQVEKMPQGVPLCWTPIQNIPVINTLVGHD